MSFRPVIAFTAASLALTAAAPFVHADSAVGWGDNSYGQLTGGNTRYTSPTPMTNLNTGVSAMAAGMLFSVSLKNGAVFVTGNNNFGQIGNGTITPYVISPVATSILTSGVTDIASGGYHSLAIKNGALYAWGWNQNGQVGDNPISNNHVPSIPTGLDSGVTEVAAGFVYSLAVKNGAVYTWGNSGAGNIVTPVMISALSSGVTAIAAGDGHSLAIKNGGLYSWGVNTDGQLGNGTKTTNQTPTLVPGFSSGITGIAAGHSHSLAIQNGNVYAWGDNTDGQLGDNSTTDHYSPALIAGLANIVQVAAGQASSYALASDGSLWVWGDNLGGELGLGDIEDRLTPTHLFAPTGFRYTSIDADANSFSVVATLAPAVPEPATLSLLALSIPLLLRRRRSS